MIEPDRHTQAVSPTVAEVVRYYGTYLEFQRHHLRLPGIQAAFFGDDRVVSMTTGFADVEAKVPMAAKHLFRIASQSKSLTAVALMQLVEKGLVRLDDTVAEHLPSLESSELRAVTLRELLSHSAGVIRDGDDGDFWQARRAFPNRRQLLEIAQQDNAAVIGRNERFKYSNVGYGLLGLVIEEKTGRDFDSALRAGVFDPLELKDSGVTSSRSQQSAFVSGYSALWYADQRVPIDDIDAQAFAPATGCFSNATDLVRFFASFLPGDTRLLRDESKSQMRHPAWDTGVENERYGLGLMLFNLAGNEIVGHAGGYPGHNTFTVVDTMRRIALSVCVNATAAPATGDLTRAFLKLLALAESTARPENHIPLERFTGRFANLTRVFDVAVLGGRLYQLNPVNADPSVGVAPLEVIDETTLHQVGGSGHDSFAEPMTYRFTNDGDVSAIRGPHGVTSVPIEKFQLPERIAPTATLTT